MARRSNRAMRNLRSAGSDAARFTAKNTGKAAVGLFRWASTDHTDMSSALEHMPRMGFLDSIKYVLLRLLIAAVGAALTGVWIALLISFGIPFLLTGHF